MMKKTFLMLVIIVLIFSSCQEEELKLEKAQTGFSVQDGYLSFKSKKEFSNTIDKIADFTEKEKQAWEQKIGFTSQQTIRKDIIDAEIKTHEITKEKFKNRKLEEINKRELHSDIYNKYLDKGLIKLINEGTKDEYWDLSVYNPIYLNFINEKGLFAINDTLYQVNEKGLKVITKNDSYFIESVDNSKNVYPYVLSWSEWAYCDNQAYRAVLGVRLYIDEFSISLLNYYKYIYNLYVYCQERQWHGGWMYCYQDIYFQGSWDIFMFYAPIHLQGYATGFKRAAQYTTALDPKGYYYYDYRDKIFRTNSSNNHPYDGMYHPTFESFEWEVYVIINSYVFPQQQCKINFNYINE